MRLKKIEPLEKNIEQSFVRWCKANGILAIKCKAPSWPDRIVFGPIGVFCLIEFKRPGKKLTINQHAIKLSLDLLGFKVHVCHSKQEAIEAYEKERGNYEI